MQRHVAFVLCSAIVLLVWIPALSHCPSLFCRLLLIACLLGMSAIYLEAFYGLPSKLQRRLTAGDRRSREHWRCNGDARCRWNGKQHIACRKRFREGR